MKKTILLLAASVACSPLYYQGVTHAETPKVSHPTPSSPTTGSTSIPWGNTGLSVTLDADGTLHLPSGVIKDPPPLNTVFGGPLSPGLEAVKKIILDGPLSLSGSVQSLFSGFTNVTEFSGFSNLNTTNVTNMSDMFSNMVSLTSLDLSTLDTKNVTDMKEMFLFVKSVTNLNLDNFDTQNITDMGAMFSNCRSISTLNLSTFNTNKLTEMSGMFSWCHSLIALDLSTFNLSETTDMREMLFDTPMLSVLQLAPNSRIRTATARYQDSAGNTIAANRVFGGPTTDSFTFTPKAIPGYTFQKAIGNTSGPLTVAPQTVTFVYTIN